MMLVIICCYYCMYMHYCEVPLLFYQNSRSEREKERRIIIHDSVLFGIKPHDDDEKDE
jgi:hypothetical protein